MRGVRALVALSALALVLGLASLATDAVAEPGRSIEYLYIEANEGGSSGGHVALGLGDEIFHFEHRSPGVLVLGLDDREPFLFRYRVLENRTIHASRIPVSAETFDLLVRRFRSRQFLQGRHLDAMEGLREDRATLEQMLSGAVEVEAAGLFASEAGPSEAPDPDLASLRARMRAAYGDDGLDRRAAAVQERLAGLDPRALDLPAPSDGDLPPAPRYSYPRRYRDAVTMLAALDVLRQARPLATGALIRNGAALDFTDADAEAARRLSDALGRALFRLIASDRLDAGVALMVGMARLVALAESQRQGRWVMVDAFPVAPTPSGSAPARRDIETALRDARDRVARTRQQIVARAVEDEFREADFAAFEAAANRLGELRQALADGRERRVLAPSTVPSRPGRRPVDELDRAALAEGLEAVRERETTYAAWFKGRWGYHLVARNCVSEIFDEMDAAFPGGAEESRARLGGRIEMRGTLNFIPAVSAAAVARAYPVTEQLELPSYRRWRKQQMSEQAHPLAVFLRESNTLTSAMYRRNADDSIFVFFTDDVVVTRPLLGAVNLAAGLVAGAVGLVTLPVDRGATLWEGLKGAVFSLPELFFQNIRKGSFWHLRRDLPGPSALPAPTGAGASLPIATDPG